MFEWSDDDKVLVAPPPSTKAPPRNTCIEGQSDGGEGVPKQQVGSPRPAGEGSPRVAGGGNPGATG